MEDTVTPPSLSPPAGVFCPRSSLHPPRTFPDLPQQFSVQIETVAGQAVSYSQVGAVLFPLNISPYTLLSTTTTCGTGWSA